MRYVNHKVDEQEFTVYSVRKFCADFMTWQYKWSQLYPICRTEKHEIW